MLVCLCKGLSQREIEEARDRGADTLEKLARSCGAGADCGSCRHALARIVENRPRSKEAGYSARGGRSPALIGRDPVAATGSAR